MLPYKRVVVSALMSGHLALAVSTVLYGLGIVAQTVAAFVGQACLATALQRGSATSAVASMDATTVVIGSVAGLALMGDRIAAGREWWVVLGVLLVVSGVLVLGRTAKPAQELVSARGER